MKEKKKERKKIRVVWTFRSFELPEKLFCHSNGPKKPFLLLKRICFIGEATTEPILNEAGGLPNGP